VLSEIVQRNMTAQSNRLNAMEYGMKQYRNFADRKNYVLNGRGGGICTGRDWPGKHGQSTINCPR